MRGKNVVGSRRRKLRRRLAAVAICLAAGSLSVAAYGSTKGPSASKSSSKGPIYVLYPETNLPAWPLYYLPYLVKALKKDLPGRQIVELSGNNDAATQLPQVEAAITAHASGVIYSPVDPATAGGPLKEFAAAHIPVVGYLNDPDGGPVYAYVWVNFGIAGQYFGKLLQSSLIKSVGHTPVRLAEIYGDPSFAVYHDWLKGASPYLDPLVKSGKVKVVCQADTTGWAPPAAQTEMDQCLTKTGNGVDAVLTMNDSVADGIAAALGSQKLLGKVKIWGGHDAELTAVQRILAGDQLATFHIDGTEIGPAAGALLAAAIAGKPAKSTGYINGVFNNKFSKTVPLVYGREILVTPSNINQTILQAKLYTKSQICAPGIAASTAFCK